MRRPSIQRFGLVILAIAAFSAQTPRQDDGTESRGWPRVYIRDPYTRQAAQRALDRVSQRLSASTCQSLVWEFQTPTGRPLAEKLLALGVSPEEYLRLVVFEDSGDRAVCRRPGILAFTTPGSRVVYLCGRDFERAWRTDPREVQASIIHEMMHSLGLGENPPTPRYITHRVQQRCLQ